MIYLLSKWRAAYLVQLVDDDFGKSKQTVQVGGRTSHVAVLQYILNSDHDLQKPLVLVCRAPEIVAVLNCADQTLDRGDLATRLSEHLAKNEVPKHQHVSACAHMQPNELYEAFLRSGAYYQH